MNLILRKANQKQRALERRAECAFMRKSTNGLSFILNLTAYFGIIYTDMFTIYTHIHTYIYII